VITRDLRHSITSAVAAAGFERAAEPGLRPTGTPGQYAASVALALGANPRQTAAALAATLRQERWIATTEVTGPGYLTITVTPEALAAVADTVTAEGPACVTSDALAGVTVPAAPPGDPLAAPTWEKARTALAAALTVSLAAAAGATVADPPATERKRPTLPAHPSSPDSSEPALAISFAGRDAVTFTLARAIPGKPLRLDQEIMARRLPANPAYAVRYAHARAASGVRWAATSSAADTIGSVEAPQSPLADSRPELANPRSELVAPAAGADTMAICAIGPGRRDIGGYGGSLPPEMLHYALSWLPERVATAARRGRPDEFARYLEDLASVTVDVLSSANHPGSAPLGNRAPGSDRLSLARAARTGLAAGLGLLGVGAPERLLAEKYREPKREPCRPPGWAASWGRAARRPPANAASEPERA
jgi:arginyl-tRNA synthetase